MSGAARFVFVAVLLVVAAAAASFARSDSPALQLPANIAVEARDATGATVAFTVKAVDPETGDDLPATCDHPSGGEGTGTFELSDRFAVGTTTVTCSTTVSGADVTASFTVTVQDTTPPSIAGLPTDVAVNTANPAGAIVHYGQPTATDLVDGNVPVGCSPASDTPFPVGVTSVTCTAADAHGNSATATFVVTVTLVDGTPPVVDVLPNLTIEAVGPTGAPVVYTPPTAIDDHDGPVPVKCVPGPGSLFSIGATPVRCTATDSHGNSGSASFTVSVVDTTPPHLVVPGDATVYATSAEGAPASAGAVAAFLASARATDLVDPAPSVSNDAPGHFPVGPTTVRFRARDGSGNEATGRATLTVRPQPPPGTTPPALPAPSDRTAPRDVTNLKARSGNRVVRLTWRLPTVADFDHVVVMRSSAAAGALARPVYKGSAAGYVDRHVRNQVQYRYVVVSFDEAGNGSAGAVVVATPSRVLLTSPRDGARLVSPPRLVWVPTRGARYYNVQLYRGNEKIRSAWPTKNAFALARAWRYAGHGYRLTRGTYRWYVWPGFGARSESRYGALLGTSSFVIVR